MTVLPVLWFFLLGVLFSFYLLLDGYVLGSGVTQLFLPEPQRRQVLRAISPVWDGNEVWLLAGGGALFAAFPPVYATVFSGFYPAVFLLLLGLVTRAVSVEFYHQMDRPGWTRLFSLAFGISSLAIALLLTVALANVARGVPVDAQGDYAGGFLGLLNPFALLAGLSGLAATTTYGALYLSLRLAPEAQVRLLKLAKMAWAGWLALFAASWPTAYFDGGRLLENFGNHPWLYLLPLLLAAALVALGLFLFRHRNRPAFVAAGLGLVLNLALAGASLFPHLVPALGHPERALTVHNASSSPYTLTVMLIIAALGLPAVIAYTAWAQKRFAYRLQNGNDRSQYQQP